MGRAQTSVGSTGSTTLLPGTLSTAIPCPGQLDVLKGKGLAEERGGRYYPRVLDLDAVKDLFDVKRSRAGRLGALAKLRRYAASRVASEGVSLFIEKVLDTEHGERPSRLRLKHSHSP